MQRTIQISTDVFAAIWANRLPGEETENIILARLLDCAPGNASDNSDNEGGFHDSRNNVHFPEGFEAIRNYKGKEYCARVQNGGWLREDTGKRYPTLNQLNETIAAGNENIWNGNWKYRNSSGALASINALRSQG